MSRDNGPTREQMDEIAKGCDTFAASLGRLIDFTGCPAFAALRCVRHMVIDCADDDWKMFKRQV